MIWAPSRFTRENQLFLRGERRQWLCSMGEEIYLLSSFAYALRFSELRGLHDDQMHLWTFKSVVDSTRTSWLHDVRDCLISWAVHLEVSFNWGDSSSIDVFEFNLFRFSRQRVEVSQ
jgi:hypothetical protein